MLGIQFFFLSTIDNEDRQLHLILQNALSDVQEGVTSKLSGVDPPQPEFCPTVKFKNKIWK